MLNSEETKQLNSRWINHMEEVTIILQHHCLR